MRFSRLINLLLSGGILLLLVACIAKPTVQPTATVVLPTIGNLTIEENTRTPQATMTSIPTNLPEMTATSTEESVTKTPNPFLTPVPTEIPSIEASMNPLTGLTVDDEGLLFRGQ